MDPVLETTTVQLLVSREILSGRSIEIIAILMNKLAVLVARAN